MNAGCPGQPVGNIWDSSRSFPGGKAWKLCGKNESWDSSTHLGRASRGERKCRIRTEAFGAEHDSLGVGMKTKATQDGWTWKKAHLGDDYYCATFRKPGRNFSTGVADLTIP